MRSFGILSVVATVAFSVFSSAAPTPLKADNGLVALRRDIADVKVLARDDTPSIPDILDGLIADLSPVVDKITALTGTGDVVAALNPILEEVVDIVGGAAGKVDGLVGSPIATLLATVGGTISVADLANLIVKVLDLLSQILSAALSLAGGDLSAFGTIISALSAIVSKLLFTILGEVDGLLGSLLPLITNLVPTLASLGLSTVSNVLGLLGGLIPL